MQHVIIAAFAVGLTLNAGAGEAGTMESSRWTVRVEEGAVTSLRLDGGRDLAAQPLTAEGAAGLEAAVSADSVRLTAAGGGASELAWPLGMGPEGYYDRLTETTYDGLVDGKPVRSSRQDRPALLRFVAGAKGHTVTVESMKRMDPERYGWALSNPGGRTVNILTADGARFTLDHGPGGGTTFRFRDGMATALFRSATGVFVLRPYAEEGMVLEDGARLPRFSFGADTAFETSTGGTVGLNELFDQFYLHATFWYPAGHGISAWAAWGPLGHAYVDAPYRLESRSSTAGQVVSDDGHGHDGYAWSWGDQPGWPFPGGYDTRHFGINAMHIVGARTYLAWTGEYGDISGLDFVLRGEKDGGAVFAQEVDEREVRLREGGVLAQGFTLDAPVDTLAFRLNIPVRDPRFDEELVPDLTREREDVGVPMHPFMVSALPGQRLAQVFTAPAAFDTVGARFCNWSTPGCGLRLRVMPWKGGLAESLAAEPLGEAIIENVPDNERCFVSLDKVQPAGTTALFVVDQPVPPAPGKEARGGVWGLPWEEGASGMYQGDAPIPGHKVIVSTGTRRHPAVEVRVLDGAGETVVETRLAENLPTGLGEVAVATALAPGDYTVELRGNGAPMFWRCSKLRTALGGRGSEDGHGWDWVARARREMDYQMDLLNAAEEHLLLLDGKAGDDDHSGVTEVTVGNHYYDILPFGGYDAYTNAWFYASLDAMADLERGWGDPARAARWEALRAKVRDRYNEVFWTEAGHLDGAARYIGCVDTTGARHDYGFSFVNTLALEVGLAPPDRAEAVLRWLDEGVSIYPDGTRKPDIYHFVFGPRTTTIDNPHWWAAVQRYEAYPYGDQIQNGGADLYESYYDLRARIETRGANDGWARLMAVLGRYAEPDRLTGGKRLYTGESIQGGGTAGGVGILSHEFPETAILGGIVVYGFLGAEARSDGLHLRPRVPDAQPFLRAENILYHGDYFTFEATKSVLKIACAPREERYDFRIGGKVYRAPFTCEVPLGEAGEVLITPVPR